MVNGGSYDMGGVWRPDNYSSAATFHFDEPNPYNRSLYSSHYTVEDDYYGAYGDLLEYENALRLSREFSEEERMLRWRERLAFEELENAERSRCYARMSERERHRLGLSGRSWWGGRYGSDGHHHHHHHRSWKERFGDRLQGWTADRLPLSSALGSRFGSIRSTYSQGIGSVGENLLRNEHRLNDALYRQQARLSDSMVGQDRYLRGVGEDRLERRLEEDRLERRIEEDRLERRLEAEEESLARDLRLEQRLDQDRLESRVLEDRLGSRVLEDRLGSRALEDRLYRDEVALGSGSLYRDEVTLGSGSLYRGSPLDSYERERGFGGGSGYVQGSGFY